MTSKIRVSEIFYSLQGEGAYLGVPSVFVRTFGCNMSCSGYGMPRGQLSTERLSVDPSKYKKYDDLPLVHTGCDSYPSWDARFKKLSPMLEVAQLVDRIEQLLPNRKFGSNVHLVITGGEPLLGWQRVYPQLLDEIYNRNMDLSHLTFETNGTQILTVDLADALNNYSDVLETTFSISSKLPSSGEPWDKAIRPEVVATYRSISNMQAYFKWVCSNPEDLEDVKRAVSAYAENDINFPVYLMAAGGTEQGYNKNKQWLSKICLAEGFRYSPRLQIDLFGNGWGT